MGWLGESEFNCPWCDGNGERTCECCDQETACKECDGTGWNARKVDLPAYLKACEELNQRIWASGAKIGSYEWIDGDKRLGRASDMGRVAIADFLRPGVAR